MARQELEVTHPDSDSFTCACTCVHVCVCMMGYRAGVDGDSGHLSSVWGGGVIVQDVCVHVQVGSWACVCVQCGAAS